MKRVRVCRLITLALVVSFCQLFAQRLHFEEYFLLRKNESFQTHTIFQDRSGIMWVGTSKGLFRFNGKTYQRFTVADSLQDDHITAIAEDSLGRLWVGCKSGKLSFLENGRFNSFTPPEGSAAAQVSRIIFDRRGRMWFSTLNDGLYYFLNSRLYRIDEQEGMPDIFVYDIVEDNNGNIWAGTDGGLVRCALDGNKAVITVFNTAKGLPDNIVKRLAFNEGKIWMSTEDAGLVALDLASQSFVSPISSWSFGSVSDFFIDGNTIYFTSSLEGLWRLDAKHATINAFHFDERALGCLFADKEGNVWIGSKSGVLRTPGDQIQFSDFTSISGKTDILAITSGSDGRLWFSTSEGLFVTDISGSNVAPVLDNTSSSKYTVISLYEDSHGYIWAGLYGQGVLRIHSKTGAVRFFSRELRNGNVLSITGKGDVVWLATLGGAEKVTLQGDNASFRNFNSGSGLSSDFIYQVFIDSKDKVWFATDGRGVDMLDEQGFHHLEDGLPAKVIYGFAEDHGGNIWVNVQANGIYRITGSIFSPNQPPFKLRDNNVNALSTDAFGNIVVMHDMGIDVLDFENNQVRYFDQRSGLDDHVATLNCVDRAADGRLVFGTNNGVVHYQTKKQFMSQTPSVAIEQVKIFDSKVNSSDRHDFAYDENNITFSFAGIWFQDVQGLTFQYMLEKYDADWIPTGDNAVTFSKLPPGDYTFYVRASSNQNFTKSVPAKFAFHIRPPFWRTNAFYAFMIVAAGLSIYSLVKFRERRLLRDKKILEMKVASRTQEIQRQKEEIQAQNEEIMAQAEEIKGINENLEMLVKQRTAELERKNKALEEYAFINAHKLRSPLASILGLTHLMSKTPLNNEAQEINKHLQQRAVELDDIVRSITKAIEKGADQR